MPVQPVDLRGALVADFPRGRIETREQKRVLAIPPEWLETLIERVPADTAQSLGLALAQALETDARAVLGKERDPSPEDVAYAISAALAQRGLGTAAFEQWGDAAVLVWRDPPSSSATFREMASAVVGQLIGRLFDADVTTVAVGSEGTTLKLLLANRAVCEFVRSRMASGESWVSALERLERAGGAS